MLSLCWIVTDCGRVKPEHGPISNCSRDGLYRLLWGLASETQVMSRSLFYEQDARTAIFDFPRCIMEFFCLPTDLLVHTHLHVD